MLWLVALALFGTLACFALGFALHRRAKSEPVWSALEPDSLRRSPIGLLRQASGGERPVQEPGEEETRESDSGKDPWLDRNYCWVVVCKNRRLHHRRKPFHVHRIPLGETDTLEPRPCIQRPFVVRCDECGMDYTYKSSEVLRYEMDVPPSFVPHPFFRG